jgi:hypothetical protein
VIPKLSGQYDRLPCVRQLLERVPPIAR